MFQFLRKLFRKKPPLPEPQVDKPVVVKSADEQDYTAMAAFLPVDTKEKQLVSLIASAIAAEAHPDTRFVIKSIKKKNPEAQRVALIAAGIIAYDFPGQQYRVTKIKKKS